MTRCASEVSLARYGQRVVAVSAAAGLRPMQRVHQCAATGRLEPQNSIGLIAVRNRN